MNFKPKLLIGGMVLILLTLIVAGVVYYLSRNPTPISDVEKETPPIQDFLQKRGEAGFRKNQALALVSVYQPMLAQYPDNLDLKKKLALAWFDAEEYAKSLPLLEEVSKTNLADAEVFDKIGEAKRRLGEIN